MLPLAADGRTTRSACRYSMPPALRVPGLYRGQTEGSQVGDSAATTHQPLCPMAIEQQSRHRLGSPRGVDVAFGRRNDRALHEDVPGVGEGNGVLNAGFLGQAPYDRPDALEVRDAGPAGWVRGAHLEKHVDERTRLEVAAPKPFIKERLEISEEHVWEALQANDARRIRSLDSPNARDDPEAAALVETLGHTEPGYEAVETQLAAEEAKLDERERRVLEMYFNEGLSQYQIGDRIGVSQMQISRITRGALRKLRDAVQGEA